MSETFDRLTAALADRYAIDREVGSGGMAVVFLAADLKHGRRVALKVLRPELAHTIGPDRFLSEIQITARLDHPHILPLLDSGEADGFLYYVMPFVEGETLRARLDRDGRLDVDEAKQIAREVANALTYAHERGVVHRDVKPGNILLQSGHARLADFGIAHAVGEAGGDRLTATGVNVGTPCYMSPEQAAGGEEIDGRSDVYSLACVLFEMIAGVPPFTGSARSVLSRHVTEIAPPITNSRPDVGAEIGSAIARALEKDPGDRPSTPDAFVADLDSSTTLPRSRRLALVVGMVAIMATSAVAYLGLRDRTELRPVTARVDVPQIAVLPFTVSGLGTEGLDLSAVSALATNLDGAAGYETIAPATVWAEWNRSSAEGGSLSQEEALEVARRTGASFAVVGSAASAGASVRLAAEVYDVESGLRVATAASEGVQDSLVVLMDRLAFDLIMSMWESGSIDLPTMNLDLITTASLDALKAYLEGDLARDRLEFNRAIEAWTRATEADSTFRQAYWRIVDGLWYAGMGTLRSLPIQRRARARLRALADSTSPPEAGIEALEWQREYLLQHPDDADAWLRLANIAETHSTKEEARGAYERAIELAPASQFYKAELAKNYVAAGDDSAAAAYWLSQLGAADKTLYGREIRYEFGATYGDSVTRSEMAASFDTIPRELLANLFRVFSNVRDADLLLAWADARAARSREFGGEDTVFTRFARANWAGFARGRLAEAERMLADSIVSDDQRAIWAMYAVLQDLPLSAPLQDVLDRDIAAGGWPDFPAADAGRWNDLAAEVERYRLRGDTLAAAGDDFGAGFNRGKADIIEAYGLWRRGSVEEGLALMEKARPLGEYTIFQRWWLGHMNLELGRGEEALDYFRLGWNNLHAWALATYYSGRSYELMGRTDDAIAAYSDFIEYWKGADPEVLRFSDDAMTRLSQLTGS